MAGRDRSERPQGRIERELAREHRERALHDDERSGLAAMEEEFRLKDARERVDTGNLKRQPGR
ncbi:hypothetical protein IM543_09905 [Massilia sp. UMI-21]|nr:hypothetical protein IM543_09905 [Massilia sp. UMI-21]